ncbi:histidine phosphatase family protein [Mycobacterium sp. Y57]|uniref:SixA phosphatase family protein n=1 Tax=Mycolicibacterium xanthum TaxID=2796469 RepID=UPI001C862ECD|nr:histidine phosphatase family protein [Mycolicibacterium xanthum]MBX7433611.1 histidine phosphatase family protein [Mycolicibacterium xanthum]
MTDGYRTLLLMRHAKSDRPPGVGDHERPLSARGFREAALAGDWMRANVSEVDAVLCSTATRTRQTLQHTGITAPVRYVDRIYDSTPGIVIEEINAVQSLFGEDPSTLLVVGHEPVMSSLALGLADPDVSDETAAEQIALKFPTSSIAVLRSTGAWADVEPGGCELVSFHIAR